jgi:hypothetical protein
MDEPHLACSCRYCEPQPGQEASFDAPDRKLMADVREHGWHVVMVAADNRSDGWTFSVGMWHTFRSPELVMAGLGRDAESRLINDIGDRVRGGYRPDPSVLVEGLLTSGLSLAVRPVDASWYRALLGYATWFAQRPPLPFVQVVWPDKSGRFPWDPEFDRSYLSDQPQLWLPSHDHSVGRWSGVLAPDPWPFDDPEDMLAITTKRITDDGPSILFVFHDADGAWQFIDDGPTTPEDVARVHLVHIVGADPTIATLVDLPRGWMAQRATRDQPWSRRPFTPDG